MHPSPFDNPDPTPPPDGPTWSYCEGLIKAFEEAWRRGEAPAIRDYLRTDGPARRPLLVELVHVDLEFRLKAGNSTRVEAYLRDYPELAGDRPVLLELIAAEYQLRRRDRPDVSLDEFCARFPEHAEDLLVRLVPADADTLDPSRQSGSAGPVEQPAVPATRSWSSGAAAAWASSTRPATPAWAGSSP